MKHCHTTTPKSARMRTTFLLLLSLIARNLNNCTTAEKTLECLLELLGQLEGPMYGNNPDMFVIFLNWRMPVT